MVKIMKTMVKTDFEEAFKEGLSEILEFKQGKRQLHTEKVCIPVIDSAKVRLNMHLSQQEFSERFGIPLATVKNWEQGRRSPDQPTSVLLYLISKMPEEIASELAKLRAHH
jgi:putative transcriptional regulator